MTNPSVTEHPQGLILTAYDYSFRFGLSFYDSLYVALSQIQQSDLITGDEALLRTLRSRFPRALGIENYTSPGSAP